MNGGAGTAPVPQPSTSVPWPLLGSMGASLAGGSPLSTQGNGLLVNKCLYEGWMWLGQMPGFLYPRFACARVTRVLV